ncbi:MAG TPA: hypothetical protein VFA70_06110 [Dehalococcoidia bacterium]|jgi:hypothetical protein|nr:hypothetical protein [Dehalococcoidia bacterium]
MKARWRGGACRATALVLLLAALCGALMRTAPARAQTISSVELAAAALDTGDVPGFVAVAELDASVPRGFDAAFSRVLYATDLRGGLLIVNLAAAGDAVPHAALLQAVTTGAVLAGLTSDAGTNANFQPVTPLGVGEADYAAVWNRYDQSSNVWLSAYGDTFVRGRIFVTLLYLAPPASAVPSVIGQAAQAQDLKIQNSQALP